MPSQPRLNRVRHGLTLIELLVVVSILLIVTVIAVPAMRPALENRKIREAARALNVYLGSARNHAIELGRPVGVLFIRDQPPGTPPSGSPPGTAYPPQYGNACLTLQQVEIPTPYAGDFANSTANVYLSSSVLNPDGTTTYTVQINFNQPINTSVWNGGDYIQFGYQGPLYLTSPSSANTATVTLPANCTVPWPTTPPGITVPFQMTLQPDNNNLPNSSAVPPLQLPAGTVIDLQASGWQTPGTNFDPNLWFGTSYMDPSNGWTVSPAIIIFSPNGGVYQVITNNGACQLIDPIYFLIGRRDRMFTLNLSGNATLPQVGAAGEVLPNDGLANWQDPNNLWVGVAPQTGRITTVENAVVANPRSLTNAAAIILARSFALQGQSKGGR
jgi:prepilin-type N-terminal cleavage/methylation domain-containing protein